MFSNKLIIIGIAVLVVIIIVVLLVVAGNNNSSPSLSVNQPVDQPDLQGGLPISGSSELPPSDNSNLEPAAEPLTPVIIPESPPLDDNARARQEILKIASAFAARFGSYSNQSYYDNIRDLETQMTPAMKRWAVNYISELERTNPRTASLFSVSTQSLTLKIDNFSLPAGTGLVTVGTRREVLKSGQAPEVINQELQIELVKVGGDWLIKAAFWQAPEPSAAQIFEPIKFLR
jgi:hypothetical protein